jgi:hypothetical protein
MEVEPDNALGYMNIGVVNFRQGNYDERVSLSLRRRSNLNLELTCMQTLGSLTSL